ncbi:MAG: YkgJ family cysteine cluster protein [Magnetococcales bacterium]|nr:YkgJ family cysteine cluster protein [Magnetococcales bacterium]
MADEREQGQPDEADRQKVLMLDEEMRDMPREVRNVIAPVRLSGKDHMQFRCFPGIDCFNACCRNIEILLTPYDLYRLRKRLDLEPEAFLFEYATPYFLRKGELPVPLLRMDEKTGRCPFNTDAGCRVYEDRPVTCRYYPIGMALMRRQDATEEEDFYFLIKEDHCHGHRQPRDWTVAEWRRDQGSDGYDVQNKDWMEFVIKRRSAGDMVKTSLPVSEMFYMASTNPAEFRRFAFGSSFMRRYQVDEATRAQIAQDDLALTEFAFRWLKSVLYGDPFVGVTPEALETLRERAARKAVEARKTPDDSGGQS